MAKVSINLKDGTVKRKEEKGTIIGIDLGTTNSLVAYIQGVNPVTIKSKDEKSSLVPSIIHFGSNNDVVVGNAAKDKLTTAPERTIYSAKRLMGKSYNDISTYQQHLGYKIIEEDDDQLVKVEVGGKFYSPIQLSSLILVELKQTAENALGQKVSKAVITVPAYFNDTQRQATRDAGKLAGLDVLRIVNEPTAASLAYGLGMNPDDQQKVAVYDLGGGTFDISILEIQNGVFEVLATNGDTFLGGDDMDKMIVDHWLSENKDLKSNFINNKSLGQSVRIHAENAKKVLSTSHEYNATVAGYNLSINLAKFNELIAGLINKTIESCQQCLKDAELTKDAIDQVILVGGSTRVPLVKLKVKEFFNREVYDKLNPDEVVALGAALQADILAGNRKDMLLLDITPLSLGIETIGGLMDTIIPRNSKVPTKVGRQYTTSVDGQKNLKIAVYQGERDLVEDNRKLGEFILKNIPPMAAGMPKIEIQFVIDADGILRVKAKELRSDVETEIEIKSQYGISEEEMAKMLLASLSNAEIDMVKRGLIEAITEANNVILHSNKFMKQNARLLEETELHELSGYIEKLKQAIDKKDKDLVQSEMEELNVYSRPIAERVMDANIANALKGKIV